MGQRLGQHFLKNKEAVKKIISCISPEKNELIIEIGPGRGALTFGLVKAVEDAGAAHLGGDGSSLRQRQT